MSLLRACACGRDFFDLFAPCILFSRRSWESPHFVDGAWVCGLPPVSRRERADHSDYLPVKRSPLTNTDETREICSESVELTQSFIKSLQVWEMGGKISVKVFGQAFFKRLAVSKGSAFGRPSQRAKSPIPEGAPKGVEFAK